MKRILYVFVGIFVIIFGLAFIRLLGSAVLHEPSDSDIRWGIYNNHGFRVSEIIEKKPFKDGNRYGCAVRVLVTPKRMQPKDVQVERKIADFNFYYFPRGDGNLNHYQSKWITSFFYLEAGSPDKIELNEENPFLAFLKFLSEEQKEIDRSK